MVKVKGDAVNLKGILSNDRSTLLGFSDPNTGEDGVDFDLINNNPFITKLRKATAINPLKQPFAIAPAAWVTATAVVQGEARSNAGNWYVASNGGTTGATAPTGTGTGLISDGTINWLFFSKAQTLAGGELPTLSFTTTDPALGKTVAGQNATNCGVLRSGKIFNSYASLYLDTFNNGVNGALLANGANQPTNNVIISTMTDAPRFAFRVAFQTSVRIIVDGVSLTVGEYPITSANPTWVIVDYTGFPKRFRNVSILGSTAFKGLDMDTASRAVPAPPPSLTGMWIGDSQANGGIGSRNADGWACTTAKYLGCGEAMVSLSAAGSGFNTQGSGSVFNYLQRLQDPLNANAIANAVDTGNLDFMVFEGTTNDNGGATALVGGVAPQAYLIQVTNTLKLARSLTSPTFPIIVTSPWGGANITNALAYNTALKNAIAQLNDPYIYYIRQLTDTDDGQAWIDSTNAASWILDGTHWADSGARMQGFRTALELKEILAV